MASCLDAPRNTGGVIFDSLPDNVCVTSQGGKSFVLRLAGIADEMEVSGTPCWIRVPKGAGAEAVNLESVLTDLTKYDAPCVRNDANVVFIAASVLYHDGIERWMYLVVRDSRLFMLSEAQDADCNLAWQTAHASYRAHIKPRIAPVLIHGGNVHVYLCLYKYPCRSEPCGLVNNGYGTLGFVRLGRHYVTPPCWFCRNTCFVNCVCTCILQDSVVQGVLNRHTWV